MSCQSICSFIKQLSDAELFIKSVKVTNQDLAASDPLKTMYTLELTICTTHKVTLNLVKNASMECKEKNETVQCS